jgi:hypothetical protein
MIHGSLKVKFMVFWSSSTQVIRHWTVLSTILASPVAVRSKAIWAVGPQQKHVILAQEIKGKAIPLQTWTGPEDSRRLRLPDFKTIGTCRW